VAKQRPFDVDIRIEEQSSIDLVLKKQHAVYLMPNRAQVLNIFEHRLPVGTKQLACNLQALLDASLGKE